MEDLSKLIESARQAFAEATQPAALEDAKAKFLGKSGTLTTMMKGLRDLAADQRKAADAEINAAKRAVEEALNARREALAQAALEKKLAEEAIDVTLPGRTSPAGGIHPVIRTWMRIEEIFRSIGFDVASGPEIENDWYTFTALNNPLNHPARSMQDTYYVDMKDEKGLLLPLRPHTSPMQVRYSRTHKPPIKVIAPGRTYRVDSDATHSPMFHQVEGLWLGENISFADLSPSYFPFTEPSVDVDMMFTTGSRKGKWLEISGAGEVHPTVVRNYGLDPEQYCGFAFGSGLERLTMLRYGIDDLRLFFEGDLRFLRQFNE